MAADTAARFRGIDELAGLVGAYCWLEDRLFAMTGAWASRPDQADAAPLSELRVFCAAVSRRHGALAGCWAERLPARAGVDAGALVRPPTADLAAALDGLAGAAVLLGARALVTAVLPRVRAVYEAHLRGASAVSEAPVVEVLVRAHRALGAEISGGQALLLRVAPLDRSSADRDAAPLGHEFERAFDSCPVFPAVWPS